MGKEGANQKDEPLRRRQCTVDVGANLLRSNMLNVTIQGKHAARQAASCRISYGT